MDGSTLTNAAVVIAITGAIKKAAPNVNGLVTFFVALVVGGILGFIQDQTANGVVRGVVDGLVAVGTVTTADRVNSNRSN